MPHGGRIRRSTAGSWLVALLIAGPCTVCHAAAFLPDDLVVYRVGDGAAPLVGTGNPVFLDEYTTGGTLVQSVALPTSGGGGSYPLVASGTATSEGLLTRSADGQYVVLAGYATTLPGPASLSTTSAAAVPRAVATVKYDGTLDTSTALTDFADANNPRTATSTDGSALWVGGGAGGVRYATRGGATSVQLSADSTNIRQVGIAGGQLYVSTQKGTTLRIGTVGSGAPTSAGQTIANLPGFPTSDSPNAFAFADLDGAPGVDTLYVADDVAGLTKFCLVAGTWAARGTAGSGTDAYRGVTAIVSGSTVTLYATRNGGGGASGGGELVKLVDTSGYNGALAGTPSVLATAAFQTAFRGVALTPAMARAGLPLAVADSYSTPFETPLTVSTPAGVLANDTGSPLTLIGHTNPAHGTLTLNADGSFTYTPAAGYSGSDSFSYTVSDAVQRYAANLPPLATFGGVAITGNGYGSALSPVPGSADEFYGLTDLGPHIARPMASNVEPLPTFNPSIGKFQLVNGQAILEQAIPLASSGGAPYSGRVNSQNPTGETLIDLNGIVLATDINGYDPEGLVALADGTFWVSDEYGPFITHFDATGKQIDRLSPLDASLPGELARREPNRGLEGLTITPDGTMLVAMMQGALQQSDLGMTDAKDVTVARIVTYALADGTVHEYAYLLDDPATNNTSVSEITALSNTTFLVDERDTNFPPAASKKLWLIDLGGATDIGPLSTVPGATYNGSGGGLLISGHTLEGLVNGQDTSTSAATLAAAGIAPVSKQLYLDIGAVLDALDPAGRFYSHDKIEGVALANGGTTIVISNDGDFGVDGVTNSSPPLQLHAKVSPVTGVQDDGEFLTIDLTHLPVVTSAATVSIDVVGGPTATPTATPSPTAGCPAAPENGCLTPGKSMFLLGNGSKPAKDKLTWKWGKGAAVSAADLSDPTASTDYTLCVYGNGSVLLSASVPHGTSWSAAGGAPPKAFKYADKLGASDGITHAQVASGAAGKSKAQAKGKGANLPAVTLPLALNELPVTVQLRNGAQCWSASYPGAPAKNDAVKLLLKFP